MNIAFMSILVSLKGTMVKSKRITSRRTILEVFRRRAILIPVVEYPWLECGRTTYRKVLQGEEGGLGDEEGHV